MMNKLFYNISRHSLLIFIFLYGYPVFCQSNLVPNPSFEQYTVCPFYLTKPPPVPWYMPCLSGPIYCNSCCADTYGSVPLNVVGGISYQYAHTGSAYIYLDYVNYVGSNERAYIQVALKDSLKKSKYYYGEYFVNIPNTLRYACNNVGMLFTDTPVYSDPNRLTSRVIPANPQVVNAGNPILGDTLNWVKISGIFKAKGGERYLTLGNFKYDTQTLYKTIQPTVNSNAKAGYYIDDVSVIPLDSMPLKADAGKDSTIHIGDSVFIGTYTNGIDTIKWQILNTNTTIDSLRPGFWVHPLVNTCYVLTQTVNGYASSDTVCITVQPLPLTISSYQLSIINEKQVLNKWISLNEVNVSHFNIQRSTNNKDFLTIGRISANNKNYNEYRFYDSPPVEVLGVVYYRIESVDNDGKKSYSEIKSLNIQHSSSNIIVYPNPANDKISIVGNSKITTVEIIDMLGRVVLVKNNINSLAITIDNLKLNKGIYIVKTSFSNNTTATQKLIIE